MTTTPLTMVGSIILAFGIYTLKGAMEWRYTTEHYVILGVGFILVSIGLVALALSYALHSLRAAIKGNVVSSSKEAVKVTEVSEELVP